MKSVTSVRLRAGLIAFALVLTQVVMPVQSAFATGGGNSGNDNGNAGGVNNSGNNGNDGNQDCPAGTTLLSKFNFNNGGYQLEAGSTSFVTINTGSTATSGTFTVTGGHTVSAVIVKGSNTSKVDVKTSPVTSGSFDNTGLANGGGNAPAISNIKFCENTVVALTNAQPTAPTNIDECGVANDTYTIPATTGVDYKINGSVVAAGTVSTSASSVTISAEAKANYALVGYTGPWTLTFPKNEACVVPKTPVAPATVTFDDACGTANDTVMIPAKTGVDYYLNGTLTVAGTYPATGTVVVTAKAQASYVLTGNVDSWSKEFTNVKCPSQNICTVSNTTYDRIWTYDGDAYPVYGASPTSGVSGSIDFQNEGLYVNTPEVASYVYGLIDAGKTPIGDVDAMKYDVLRQTKSAGIDVTLPAYILYVDTNGLSVAGGETFFWYEPYYNDNAKASVEGTFQTWDAYAGGSAKWYVSSTGQKLVSWSDLVKQYSDAVVLAHGFNQGTSNAQTYSVIQNIVFDCATIKFKYFQGNGGTGGETPTNPTTPTTPVVPVVSAGGQGAVQPVDNVLPEELPMTGSGSVISTWFALLAAVLTYGAVLYLQPKKRIEE